MYALLLVGAGACSVILGTLDPTSQVRNVIIVAWLLAPYLVLTGVMMSGGACRWIVGKTT